MAGYAYDETPAPTDTIGFELPDSDAQIYSLGVRYAFDKSFDIGIAGLYDKKKSVDVNQWDVEQDTRLIGGFSNAKAYLVTVGMSYKF
jgi:long-chain fatty acid transport protein